MPQSIVILAIETSCDETAAAVISDGIIRSNIIASQHEHEFFGGVVPELASRAHLRKIIPVTDAALADARVTAHDLSAVAFTAGPGLIGSLMVGSSFAKSLALVLEIPLIAVHHMQAHVHAHFISGNRPEFPFLCLTVSGGHTQLVLVRDFLDMEIIGETRDDAAGEAFDKTAKLLHLPYPGGPLIDQHAAGGNPQAFVFPEPVVEGFDFSFSGLKTAILYFLRERQKQDPDFIIKHLADICASVQMRIVTILLKKLEAAADSLGVNELAIAGGVAANSVLRQEGMNLAARRGFRLHIPPLTYCTDNAAMVASVGYRKFLAGRLDQAVSAPSARMQW